MRGMTCRKIMKRLSAYQDGALNEAQTSVLREHLAQCVECAAVFEELQRTWQALDLCPVLDASPGFMTAVLRRVQEKLPRPVWQAPRWAVAASLLLCLAFGGAAGYVQSRSLPAAPPPRIALAAGVSRQLGLEAFGPAPADTLAGAYVQFAGNERGR